ncbi:MAG: hypothetical protein GX937_00210 [Lentisphaerae bacterium]|jgi:hypothetical protein|nr:hypothetical protein [Lentisphaerota bacterium]
MTDPRQYWLSHLLNAGLLLLFIILAAERAQQLMGQDEISHYFKLAGLLFHEGYQNPSELITFSPHAYPLWIVAVCHLAGTFTPAVVKSAGVVLWLFCLQVVVYICRRLGSDDNKTKIHACAELEDQSSAKAPGQAATELEVPSQAAADAEAPRSASAVAAREADPDGTLAAILALLLCFTMPAVIQAAVTVDIDQAALPLLILLLCLAAERYSRMPSWRSAGLVALAAALAMWGRLTTPVIIMPVLVLHAGLAAAPGVRLRRAAVMAAALAIGGALFLLTWQLYCRVTGINGSGVFRYFATALQATTIGERGGNLQKWLQSAAALALWGVNPFLLTLFALDGWQRLTAARQTHRLAAADLYWLAAAVILVGYLFVGGALFGFPKYHCPALPLLAICLAQAVVRERQRQPTKPQPGSKSSLRRQLAIAVVLTAALALLAGLLLRDPIWTLRVEVRTAQLLSLPVRPILLRLAVGLTVVYGLGTIAVLLLAKSRRLPIAVGLLAAGLAPNLALLAIQTAAPYATGYIYGEEGETNIIAGIIAKHSLEQQPLFVPVEVVQHLGWSDTRTPGPEFWNDPDTFARRIHAEQPALVAASVLIHSVPTLQKLLADRDIQQALAENYQFHELGRFFVWTRNDLEIDSLMPASPD